MRTDEDPLAADDQSNQHLLRALELLELEAGVGEIDQRVLFDVMAHIRIAAVREVIDD